MKWLACGVMAVSLVGGGSAHGNVRCPTDPSQLRAVLKQGAFTGALDARIDYVGRSADRCFYRYEWVFGEARRMSSRTHPGISWTRRRRSRHRSGIADARAKPGSSAGRRHCAGDASQDDARLTAGDSEGTAGVKRLRLVGSLTVATLLVTACAGGTATVAGTLEVGNGACVWVRGSGPDGDDRYWLRHLPSGYDTDEHGLVKPDGSRIRIGDSLMASGALSWLPLERNCGTHALDVTAIR